MSDIFCTRASAHETLFASPVNNNETGYGIRFKRLLRRLYEGNLTRAWRQGLDLARNGHVTEMQCGAAPATGAVHSARKHVANSSLRSKMQYRIACGARVTLKRTDAF